MSAHGASPSVSNANHRGSRVLFGLLVLIPAAAALDHAGGRAPLVFVTAIAALVPLASFLGRATEELAIRSTPALGALLNASLIVRASIVGSIATNLLLLLLGTSSANQILLFVVPILVLIGALGGRPFSLQFSFLELAAMLFPVLIINHLSADGVCNWLEGVLLIALYAIVATAFFFIP